MFDSAMSMEQQMNAVCRSGYTQLQKIGRFKSYLSSEARHSLDNGLVTSRIDYSNARLHGVPNTLRNSNVSRIQQHTLSLEHLVTVALHWSWSSSTDYLCSTGYNTRYSSIHTMHYTLTSLYQGHAKYIQIQQTTKITELVDAGNTQSKNCTIWTQMFYPLSSKSVECTSW